MFGAPEKPRPPNQAAWPKIRGGQRIPGRPGDTIHPAGARLVGRPGRGGGVRGPRRSNAACLRGSGHAVIGENPFSLRARNPRGGRLRPGDCGVRPGLGPLPATRGRGAGNPRRGKRTAECAEPVGGEEKQQAFLTARERRGRRGSREGRVVYAAPEKGSALQHQVAGGDLGRWHGCPWGVCRGSSRGETV